MKGIEERAILNLQYEKDFLGRNLSDDMVCRAYIKGATEQKAIDIEKACEWIKENIEGGVHPQSAYGFVEKFRKTMEE